MIWRNRSGGFAGVPRNIRCSKKWAKPDLPGSTSLREPVWTGIWMLTRFGKPVGTTMTLRPLARVVSVARNGRTSRDAFDCADSIEVMPTAENSAAARNTRMSSSPEGSPPYGRLCRHAAQAPAASHDRARVALPDVPDHVCEPPEPGHGRRRHQPGPAPFEEPARPGAGHVRDYLRDLPDSGRLDRRRLGRAAHAVRLRADLGDRDGPHGPGRRAHVAVHGAPAARRRGRRHVPGRHAR